MSMNKRKCRRELPSFLLLCAVLCSVLVCVCDWRIALPSSTLFLSSSIAKPEGVEGEMSGWIVSHTIVTYVADARGAAVEGRTLLA